VLFRSLRCPRHRLDVATAIGRVGVRVEIALEIGELHEARTLPRLVQLADLQGDLHSHTNATDGRGDIESMARAAQAAGLRYLAITDHSKSLAMANGLDEARALAHARTVREIGARLEGITLLAGIECDIRPDGAMDLADDCLAQLDLVVASIHSGFNQEPAQVTDRLLRALECPWVDVLGHPTGRVILRREPLQADWPRVFAAAAAAGVCLEINCQVDRLDLDDLRAHMARDAGATMVISSDAHSTGALANLRWGVVVARRAWLTPADVLNTRDLAGFRAGLRRHRRAA